MIQGQTILCFASGYEAAPTSKHHVMHLLARHNTVLWVNYHASRTPSVNRSDLRRLAGKFRQAMQPLRQARPNLFVLTPLVVPLPNWPAARRINRLLLISRVRRSLAQVAAGPVQLWSFTPDIAYVLGRFGETRVVYYCVDDFASFTGYNRRQVLADEEELCRRADLVVVTSRALQQAKAGMARRLLLLPHGVEYEHFSKAVSGALPMPQDLRAIPSPRLGFFGMIRDWIDLDLVAQVARGHPQWHFVFIGDATIDLSVLRALPNIHFLGPRPYEQLPAYCRHLDAGLIPFKLNELTAAVNPIKLREYLAAGLPVVSTPLPEVAMYRHMVHLAEGPGQFADAIAAALAEKPDRRQRSLSMASESWTGKLEQLCRQIEDPLPPQPALARPS